MVRVSCVVSMVLALSALVAGSSARAVTPAEAWFERFKAMAGTWEGTAGHRGEAPNPTVVTYRVTAGGATVEETLFGGTPHEMVTMYHLNGPQLMLTHYCAAGNQPRMRAVDLSDAKTLRFDFLDGTNMSWDKDGHMHSAIITFVDADHVQSEWTFWEGGKASGVAKFDLHRKRS